MNTTRHSVVSILRKFVFWILYAAFFIFTTTFLLFALIEAFPVLERNPILQHVKYYVSEKHTSSIRNSCLLTAPDAI